MIDVLCFDCGKMFTVPFGVKNPAKMCPDCRDKIFSGKLIEL